MTTKEGRWSRVMSVPCSAPSAALANRPTMTPAHHGQLYGRRDQRRDDGAPDGGHVADREVDLAQQQGEDLGRAQQDEERPPARAG